MRWTTTDPRGARRWPSRALAAALALLCAAALLGGSLELHGNGGGHFVQGQGAGLSAAHGDGGTVFACAPGHGPSSHVERARPVERHACAACLHRVQSRSGGLSTLAVARVEADAGAAWAPRPARVTAPVLGSAPSRGPPAA